MKRSTLIMIGVFALLLVVWLVRGRKQPVSAPPALDVAGYIGNVSEQDARSQAKDTPPPVTQVVLQRKDEKIVLVRAQTAKPPKPAEGDKPVEPAQEAKWLATRTHGGKSTEAKAQAFRAQSMAETLQRTIRSTFSHEIKPDQLAEYGLDADHAIDVELTLPERTVKLRIGQLEKGQDVDSSNTWVQDPARPGVAYQVAGRDLRTSFDVTWGDLRDRGVLALEMAAVDRLEIDNPAATKAKKIIAVRPALTAAQLKDLADKKPGRDAGEGWSLQEPAGTPAGDIGEWLRAVDRLSAEEFLDTSDVAEKKLDTGLQDAATAVRLVIGAGGKETVVVFGKQDDKKRFFATVQGHDEVVLVPSYAHDQIVQTLDQLRDRRLLGARKAKDITGFSLHGSDGEVVGRHSGDTWTLTRPVAQASAKAVDAWMTELEGIKLDFAELPTPDASGLDAPATRLELQVPGGVESVALGKEVEGNTWGRVTWPDGKAETFKLSTWNAKRMQKKAADLLETPVTPAGHGAGAGAAPTGVPAGAPTAPGFGMEPPASNGQR